MNIGFTKEQMKAIKAVERAMNKAGKLNVSFWDNYGSMTAFNKEKITMPVPNESFEIELTHGCEATYWIDLSYRNFHSGNADDSLYYNIKQLPH